MIPCPSCQLHYDPTQTPSGLCPRCLLLIGPESEAGDGARTADWDPPAIADLQAMLPDYEILGLIGRGGMGAVYKARQRSLDRVVAIKILPQVTDALGVGYIERFKNEARVLAALDHPGIVHVYDFGELPGQLLHFVMEYVDGTDVARLVAAQGRLSPEHAASITADVCAALHCAHEAGVVHRDVKPANILVGRDGRIKVADFGLAKKSDGEARSLTTVGLVLGTADYSAPEALVGGTTVDHRADLYAVGVMLYQMLTGEIPRGVFPPASEKAPNASRGFDEVITKAMQTEPERRYQSAAVMRTDVERASATPAARRRAGRKTMVIGVAAGALALAAVAVLAFWRPWRPVAPPAPAPAAAAASKSAPSVPPKPVPNIRNPERQRTAAEWVLAKGGQVGLDGEESRREAYWSLPKRPFQVEEIYFENVSPVGGPITDEELRRYLPDLPALRQFVIIQSPGIAAGISDTGARLIGASAAMQDIGLDGVRLSEATVRRLAALPKLRALVLSHSPIHGDSLRPAADRLMFLSFTYCDIDAEGWKVIATMQKLELARFIGSSGSDAMVETILALKSLRQLGWLEEPASNDALNRIKAGNPKLKVRIFKTWNTTEPPPLRPAAP